MRRVRNPQIQSSNPGLLFARGVERLVNDQLYNPAHGDTACRKPRVKTKESKAPAGNFFSEFLRQFVF
ncbi:MAG: hypothetical protein PVI70_03015 [Gammaproteobacteria bacterium]